MKQAKISAQGIYKNFQVNDLSLRVLKGISYEFNQGSSYAITGLSGSGKSTLIHILGGLDAPTDGKVFFNDHQLSNDRHDEKGLILRNKYLGFVFQLPYLIKELSVVENVMLKGLIQGLPYAECEQKAIALLTAIGLQEKAHCSPTQLSGGQQQRMSILRGLFNEPAFLFADEPTGNLDSKSACDLIDFLADCRAHWNMGLIVSTHDMDLVAKMENHLRLEDGILLDLMHTNIIFKNDHKTVRGECPPMRSKADVSNHEW